MALEMLIHQTVNKKLRCTKTQKASHSYCQEQILWKCGLLVPAWQFLGWCNQFIDILQVSNDVSAVDDFLHHGAGQLALVVNKESRHAKATRGKIIVLDLVSNMGHFCGR